MPGRSLGDETYPVLQAAQLCQLGVASRRSHWVHVTSHCRTTSNTLRTPGQPSLARAAPRGGSWLRADIPFRGRGLSCRPGSISATASEGLADEPAAVLHRHRGCVKARVFSIYSKLQASSFKPQHCIEPGGHVVALPHSRQQAVRSTSASLPFPLFLNASRRTAKSKLLTNILLLKYAK
ncbi:hypothetical protein BC834DRAFT_170892 [Gloeopeniophorella convolvens]|nr:hypothetical protein BC834DRAFT_170892 [Gloeopeniophorella convolvens]